MARAPLRWCLVLAAWIGLNVAFQLALAIGAPWGSEAWGGGNAGTLPLAWRLASGAAALAWSWVALVVAGVFLQQRGRHRVLLVLSVLSLVGIAMNLASPSAMERAIWVPYGVILAVLSWTCWAQSRRRVADMRENMRSG